jgi:hypothetical protein
MPVTTRNTAVRNIRARRRPRGKRTSDRASPPPSLLQKGRRLVLAAAPGAMVSVELTAEPEGVTLDGENEHWSPEGEPVQLKVTAWANPFCGVTVRVKVAD